jgi:hypothetical protein
MNRSPRRLLSLTFAAAALTLTPAARGDDTVASQARASLQQTLQMLQDTTAASGIAQLGDATCALAGSELATSRRVAVPATAHGGMLTPDNAAR